MSAACQGVVNVIYERYLFNTRVQQPNESVDSFYASLLSMSKTCSFDNLADSLIRDRLVVGLRDSGVRKKLLYENDLTLKRTLEIARSHEATTVHITQMNATPDVNAISRKPRKHKGKRSHTSKHTSFSKHQDVSCPYCNNQRHERKNCPARNAICKNCRKRGHFALACRKQNADLVEEESYSDEDDDYGLDAIFNMDSLSSKAWYKEILVNGSDTIKFKIDTGADVTVLPYELYRKKFPHVMLFPVNTTLRVPGGSKLMVVGKMKSKIKYKDRILDSEIYVSKSSTPLLSRDDSTGLDIVKLVDSIEQYPNLFEGLGTMPEPYRIQLKENATPYAISTARRISHPLKPKVKEELKRLEQQEVIRKVDDATDWCAPIVPVLKPNGQVRLCVDYKHLNEAVKRELYMLPSVDQILGEIGDAVMFSKLDANSGFHQILLDEDSQRLTTFMSPYGRYCYLRLPFGINSAPEHFQHQMQKILEGLDGVLCMMDDIVVFGQSKEDHDTNLHKCLERLSKAGVTLNKEKCKFHQSEIEFLGHIVGKSGIKADPNKISAMQDLEEPTDLKSLRRFLGMVNQLGKFLPDLATVTEPLRQLLSPKNVWIWSSPQKDAFQKIKQMLTSTPVLVPYNSTRPTKISADSSSYGLGAVLTQKQKDGLWKPVTYASRSLTETEKRYAQVEKEALASLWACTRFQDYIYGIHFVLETDHKPLVALLGNKSLDQIPPRIQRMKIRMLRYSYEIRHVPGKDLYTADTLSRAPLSRTTPSDLNLAQDIASYVNEVINAIPISDSRLEEVRQHQHEDHTCRLIMTYIEEGWPSKHNMSGTIGLYNLQKMHLTIDNGIILYDNRLLIPPSLRHYVLDKIHSGHQGISKCRARARQSVWWPGINRDIEDLVKNCRECIKQQNNKPEPLIPTPTPDYPWQKVASDLFEYEKRQYLLLVDYYSRFIEVTELSKITSEEVILAMKKIFSRNGRPQCLITDNGRQYVSEEFKNFVHKLLITHITSSPGHHSGNGLAERTVRTIKELWKPSEDMYDAILAYHSTPLSCGYSPAELFMGRKIRSQVPSNPKSYEPKSPPILKDKEEAQKVKSMLTFNRKTQPLPILSAGQKVWVRDRAQEGTIKQQLTPRSYTIETPTGKYRRNHIDLNPLPDKTTKPPCSPERNNRKSPSAVKPPEQSRKPETPIKVKESITKDLNAKPLAPPSTPQVKTTRSGRIIKPRVIIDM